MAVKTVRKRTGGAPKCEVVARDVVARFMAAMGCMAFDVAIHGGGSDGGWFERHLGIFPDDVFALVPTLLRKNLRGAHIYVRPAGDHGLVLVDDLTLGIMEQMAAAGVEPAVVVRTSEFNHQAWIKLSDGPVEAERRKAVARLVAVAYGADRGSADATHFGRMPGFLNMKPKHVGPDGRHPWAMLWDATGQVASASGRLLADADAAITSERAQRDQLRNVRMTARSDGDTGDVATAWQVAEADFVTRQGPASDRSARDFSIVLRLLRLGHGADDVREALALSRPDRGKDAARYAMKTLACATLLL